MACVTRSVGKLAGLLQCTGLGGLGNLSDPVKARQAVRDHHGPEIDARTVDEQTALLNQKAPRLLEAGVAARAVAVGMGARDAIVASWGPLSDAVQLQAIVLEASLGGEVAKLAAEKGVRICPVSRVRGGSVDNYSL